MKCFNEGFLSSRVFPLCSQSRFQGFNLEIKCVKHFILILILALFMSEAVEASRCYFFENFLKPIGTIFHKKYPSFYPSEPFRYVLFTMIHPVMLISYVNHPEKVLWIISGTEFFLGNSKFHVFAVIYRRTCLNFDLIIFCIH